MAQVPREIVEFMAWARNEIALIRNWQNDRDENQKWFTRLVVGGVILAVITNMTGACFSAAAVVFVVLSNPERVAQIVNALSGK